LNVTSSDSVLGKPFDDLDSSDNGFFSPVTFNPRVFFSPRGNATNFTLSIDSTQFGRVFQDRSHAFRLVPSPVKDQPIYNLNVMGKRGNAIQSYPALTYRFVPRQLNVNPSDWIHVQWTGATDGAYPDGLDGNGLVGTDRHNMVDTMFNDLGRNYIWSLKESVTTVFNSSVLDTLAWIGHEECFSDDALASMSKTNKPVDQLSGNCGLLNGAPTSYFDGGLIQATTPGTWNYLCTRNNAFGRRLQKGSITVALGATKTSTTTEPTTSTQSTTSPAPKDALLPVVLAALFAGLLVVVVVVLVVVLVRQYRKKKSAEAQYAIIGNAPLQDPEW
jgi:hypothetical protein